MNKNEQLQYVWKLYQEEHGHLPTGTREVTDWAVGQGLLEPPVIDPLDVLAGDMSRALREEYRTDSKGRRYRVNQAVRASKNGVQHTLWGVAGFVDPSHSIKSFAQRREQIIGDCHQLKNDVDVHNDNHPVEQQYRLDLDFTEDVAEREILHDAA